MVQYFRYCNSVKNTTEFVDITTNFECKTFIFAVNQTLLKIYALQSNVYKDNTPNITKNADTNFVLRRGEHSLYQNNQNYVIVQSSGRVIFNINENFPLLFGLVQSTIIILFVLPITHPVYLLFCRQFDFTNLYMSI